MSFRFKSFLGYRSLPSAFLVQLQQTLSQLSNYVGINTETTQVLLEASAVSLTTDTVTTITSLTVPSGTWDIVGYGVSRLGAGVTGTRMSIYINSTNTAPDANSFQFSTASITYLEDYFSCSHYCISHDFL
jgi:hypothetical protein